MRRLQTGTTPSPLRLSDLFILSKIGDCIFSQVNQVRLSINVVNCMGLGNI